MLPNTRLAQVPSRPLVNPGSMFEAQALSLRDTLYGGAVYLTRNPTDAEDLVHETYVRAFRFVDRFRPGTDLKAWLVTILNNTHRNARRRAGRDPVEVDSEAVERAAGLADPRVRPDERLMLTDAAAELRAALNRLPNPFRQAIWLRDVQESSYAEIADMLAVPVGTVMSRISRGRRLLYEQLGTPKRCGIILRCI